MKKIRLSRILSIGLICALLPGMASAATIQLAYKDGSLNLRSGPGTNYKSLGYLHDGDKVGIIKYGDVWTKILTSDDKVGYVKNLYIDNGDADYATGTSYLSSSYTAYTTANVHLRAGAGTDNTSMGVLKKGSKLRVLGQNGKWYLVETSAGTQGYIYSSFVSKASTSSSTSNTITRTVTGRYVNMRSGGGMSYAVIAVLTKGTQVQQLYRGNYWTKVQYKNYTGWIKNTYLK